MTTALNLSGKEIVLEIGTGSGYQASILSLLCRRVYTIERIKTLHEFSNKKFKELKLNNITTKFGNGSLGWPEVSPFDRIILTCAINQIPKQLFLQLKIGGILKIFFPTAFNFSSFTPLTPRLSFPKPGLNLDQAPSNHFNSDL